MESAKSGEPRASCGNCGAEISVPPSGGLITCEFCETPLYVEVEGTVRHFVYRPMVEDSEVAGHVNAWLFQRRENSSVQVTKTRIVYYPFWRVTRGQKVELIPAAASPEGPLSEISSPSGELVPFDAELDVDGSVVAASSPPPFRDDAGSSDDREVWLVHVPVYHVTYEMARREEIVLVEATAGKVVASTAPPGTVGLTSSTDGLVLWGGLVALVAIGVLVPWSWVALAGWGIVGTAVYLLVGRRMGANRA